MTRYRCVVFQSTGNYIPYSGLNFMAASDAFDDSLVYGVRTVIQEKYAEHEWRDIVTYQPGRV